MSDHEILNLKKNAFKSLPFNSYKRTVHLCAPENYLFSATETMRKAYARYDNELIFCPTPLPVISFDI